MRFSKKLISRSKKVIKSPKSLEKDQKGQFSIFFKCRPIEPQNEALDVSFSKKVDLEVNKGHQRSKIAEKGQIKNFMKGIQ